MNIAYPQYDIALPEGLMAQCLDLAPRLLKEAGLRVPNARFLSQLRDRAGITIDGEHVRFDEALVREHMNAIISVKRRELTEGAKSPVDADWTVVTNGYSMMVRDVATDELREGTRQDLRDMIRLASSFGVGGQYMVMPQDLPPLLRTLACFKTCWEECDTIVPYDYQAAEQIPFLYEMHTAMEKPMDIRITIPTAMTVDPKDLDIFLDVYPLWKRHGNIRFVIGNYAFIGLLKPITVPGCATMMFCENLAAHILFKLFDPDIELGVRMSGGHPTDMRSTCWAFGSPRGHVFRMLGAQLWSNFCGLPATRYRPDGVRLETSSPCVDALAGMEKMGTALVAAMQGCRRFSYAGTLCVDDVYSGTQLVIDLEIVKYVREVVESFAPHPDIINTEGLYEEMLDVAQERDTFISHPNTVSRFRNIVPSSDLIAREKLRSWMAHHRTLKDRARDVALDRIANYEKTFRLPDDKQKALDRVYGEAEKAFS